MERREQDEMELAEFERKLRMALQRREAPMGLKARVLAQSRARRRRFSEGGGWVVQRIAASAVLAAIASGIVVYRQMEVRAAERQKGEQARAQVMLALRITGRALDRVNERINDRSSSSEESR